MALLALASSGIIVVFFYFQGWIPDVPVSVLGVSGELIVIAAVGGFLGSFVRELNTALTTGFPRGWSILTMIFGVFMRPAAGSMLGLFMLAVFGSGFVAMPIGDASGTAIADVTKVNAFIFMAAFSAGIVDRLVINLVERFIEAISSAAGGTRQHRESDRQVADEPRLD